MLHKNLFVPRRGCGKGIQIKCGTQYGRKKYSCQFFNYFFVHKAEKIGLKLITYVRKDTFRKPGIK